MYIYWKWDRLKIWKSTITQREHWNSTLKRHLKWLLSAMSMFLWIEVIYLIIQNTLWLGKSYLQLSDAFTLSWRWCVCVSSSCSSNKRSSNSSRRRGRWQQWCTGKSHEVLFMAKWLKRGKFCIERNDYRSSVFSAPALNKLVSSVGYFCLQVVQVVQKVICSMNPTKLENLKFLTVTS